jgi:hypothetical protein
MKTVLRSDFGQVFSHNSWEKMAAPTKWQPCKNLLIFFSFWRGSYRLTVSILFSLIRPKYSESRQYKMMPKICILVLSGFPASGKTTLAKGLCEHLSLRCPKYVTYHVCYDSILSTDVEQKLLEITGKVDSSVCMCSYYSVPTLVAYSLVYTTDSLLSTVLPSYLHSTWPTERLPRRARAAKSTGLVMGIIAVWNFKKASRPHLIWRMIPMKRTWHK